MNEKKLEEACKVLNQFKLNPEGCREWQIENHINHFAIAAVFNSYIQEEAEKKLNEFKASLLHRLPQLSQSVEEVKTGGMPVINWANGGSLEEMPFRYGLLIKEGNVEKVLRIPETDSLLSQAYKRGATAGALSGFFVSEVGQHIGNFLDRNTGGRLACVNTNARNCAEHEASRTIENIKTKATSLGKCQTFSV